MNSNNYVDKATFLHDIREYHIRKSSNPDEPIPNYSANAILQIANKMANRPNFIGYSYRQDMVSDGVYVCLKYFDKFNPDLQTYNPFGYFSRCIWFAFLQRLAKEKKQTTIKSKILASAAFESFALQHIDSDEDFKNSFTEFLQDNNHSFKGGEISPVDIISQTKDDVLVDAIIDADEEDLTIGSLTFSESEFNI